MGSPHQQAILQHQLGILQINCTLPVPGHSIRSHGLRVPSYKIVSAPNTPNFGHQSQPTPLVAQRVKNLPAIRETRVWFLGWEDPLEEGMATHCSIPAWRIPMDREAWQGYSHTTEWLSQVWVIICTSDQVTKDGRIQQPPNSINLLEWLTKLKGKFYLLDHQFFVKGYNSRTARSRETHGTW